MLTNLHSSFPAPLAVLWHCFLLKATHLEYTKKTALDCPGATSSILWDDAGSCRPHHWPGWSSCKGLTRVAVTSATFLWSMSGGTRHGLLLGIQWSWWRCHRGPSSYRWPWQFSLVVLCHYDDSSDPSARFWRPQCSVQVSHHWHHFSTLLLMCSYYSSTAVWHFFEGFANLQKSSERSSKLSQYILHLPPGKN